MGRAIVREPQAFLMDEPLSNLDAKLRVQMRAEILRIQQELQVTTIYVTHDQTEAMTLGDLVAVMKRGVLQQVAAPQVLYKEPTNLFVAGFIGSPAMNLVQATVSRADGAMFVAFADRTLRIAPEALTGKPRLVEFDRRPVILGIRPEDMDDAALVPSSTSETTIPVSVDLREGMGSDVYLHFTVDAPPVFTEDTRDLAADVDAKALQDLKDQASEQKTTFITRAGPETTAQVGDRMEIHVDTRKLYFFDPATGEAIHGDRAGARGDAAGALTT
jgi:multiple sugar transport system ATP-binding protein